MARTTISEALEPPTINPPIKKIVPRFARAARAQVGNGGRRRRIEIIDFRQAHTGFAIRPSNHRGIAPGPRSTLSADSAGCVGAIVESRIAATWSPVRSPPI